MVLNFIIIVIITRFQFLRTRCVKQHLNYCSPVLSILAPPSPVIWMPNSNQGHLSHSHSNRYMCSANPACERKSAGQQNDTCMVKFMTYKESFAVLLQESDGSWEDLSDEEREAEEDARRAKGKLPLEGPVLEEIERQEAEMRAQQQDNDSD